ncbi:MAG: TetR/AcrR family transcriptional regulator [Syntrophobacteraceae bacterium]
MATRKLGTEVRKEQIVQAALSLVAAQGVSSLSMAALANLVGLGVSSLYRHFTSKDQVLDAVISLLREKLLGNVRRAVEEAATLREQLRRLLEMHMRLILEYQAIPRLFFSGELYAGHQERREALCGVVRSYLAEVAGILRRGQKEGAFRPDLDPEAAAVVFLGLIQPPAILWHLTEGKFDVGRQLEKAWPLFLGAIGAGEELG